MHDIWISLLNLDYRQRWACGACPAAPLLVLSDLLKKVVCWFFAESVWRKERSSQILNLKSRETFRLKEDKSKTPQNLVWMLQTCSVSTCRTVWFQREISPALCFFSFFFLPDFLGYSRFSAGSDSLMRVWILNPVQIWVFGSYVFASRSEQTVLVEVQPAGSGHVERTNVEWCLLTVFLIIFRCCCCVCCLVCLPIQSQSTGFSWESPSLAKYMKVEKLYMRQYLRQSKCLKSPPPLCLKKKIKGGVVQKSAGTARTSSHINENSKLAFHLWYIPPLHLQQESKKVFVRVLVGPPVGFQSPVLRSFTNKQHRTRQILQREMEVWKSAHVAEAAPLIYLAS